jgi:hypothetical protein
LSFPATFVVVIITIPNFMSDSSPDGAAIEGFRADFANLNMNPLRLEDDTQSIGSKARLRGLKTRKNALTPLLALPDDVLYKILHALVCSDHYSFNYNTLGRLPHLPHRAFTKPSVWMPVMGVCTQLRNLAIESPLLWSYLDFGSRSRAEWIDLCLARCTVAPLSICSRTTHGVANGLNATHIRRARVLILDGFRQVDVPMELLSHAAPFLHFFCSINQWPLHHKLSNTFLSGASNMLTELIFYRVHLAATVPELPSVTHLHLDWVLVDDEAVRIHRLIKHMPRLEHLAVYGLQCTGQDDTLTPLHFPRLRALHISAEAPFVISFLTILPVPRDECLFKIEISPPQSPVPDTDPRSIALRTMAFQRVQRFLGPSSGSPFGLTVHLYPQLFNYGETFYYFVLRQLTASGREVTFEDESRTISGYGRTWLGVKDLRVHGSAVAALFDYIAEGVLETALVDVEYLVLQHPSGDLASVLKWVSARARPLHQLMFTGLKHIADPRSALCMGILAKPYVGEVLVHDEPIDVEHNVEEGPDTDCDLDDLGIWADSDSE